MTADTLTKDESIRLMQAEIERLRKDFADLLRVAANDASEHQAEIERLRTALVANDDGHTAYQSGWHARDAEIERLREENALLAKGWQPATPTALRDEIEQLREEATQLRQAVGMLTTLHPTMEIDVNNPVQMAQEIVSYVTESKDAEIERLRGDISYLESQNSKTIHRAATEIERLREELRLCIHVDKHIHITSGLNIEIERLREAHEACSWQLRNVLDSRDARDTEIARLRDDLQRAHTMWQDARIELKRMQEYYEPDPGNAD